MKETTNYKLKKPEMNDVVNIDDFNGNMDTLDEEIKSIDTKKADIINLDKKVDKVSGKSLSSNDYTDNDKGEVAKISNKVDKIQGKSLSTNDYTNTDKNEVSKIKNKADKSYVDEEVSKAGKVKSVNGLEGNVIVHGENIKISATSNEMISSVIDKKVDKITGKGLSTNDYTSSEKAEVGKIKDKVDKIQGKGLSTNDYTTSEKSEVAKIKDKAEISDITNYGSISDKGSTGEVNTKHLRQVNASDSSTASDTCSQVNASSGSAATGYRSQANASRGSTASGTHSQVNASDSSTASHSMSQVNVSTSVMTNDSYVSVWGRGSGVASTQNRKVEINSEKGTVKATGSITGNSSFADFAEYMETSNGKSIPFGTIVSLDKGQKIKIAGQGDFPIGIISATAGIILNAQGFEWADRYLYDRYGQPILVEQEIDGELEKVPMINPEYNPDTEYIPREDRPEWNVVGMKGQIYVNIDKTVEEHDFVECGKNGLATKGNSFNKNWMVMEITTPYQEELGHGIARIII